MKPTYPLCLALTLLMAVSAWLPLDAARADADAEVVATTPADLAELLGPGGLEGVSIESRLKLSTKDEDDAGIECCWIGSEQDQLVIDMQTRDGPHGVGTQHHRFSADGLLVESRHQGGSIDYETTKTATRDGDQIHLTHVFRPANEEPQFDEEVVPYQPISGTIPSDWLPLAYAYHMREGNTRFIIRLSDDYSGRNRYVQTFHVTDAGVEEIEVAGELREAHVLSIRFGIEVDGQPMDLGPGSAGDSLQLHVLPDGTVVRLRMETRGFVVSGEAVSEEEADEILRGVGDGSAE